jgi:hypothetical protein
VKSSRFEETAREGKRLSPTFKTLSRWHQMSLFNLPKDLFQSLLLSWLGHLDVGRLDSAICNTGHRKQFLSSVIESAFVLSDYYQPAVGMGAANRLDLFMSWLMRRRIAASQLAVTFSCIHCCSERLNYLKHSGNRVREIIISTLSSPFNECKAAIKDICVHCPNISVIEYNFQTWGFGTPEHAHLINTIASNCPQLRQFYTGERGLTDGDLAALGKGCPHLTTIEHMGEDVTDTGLLSVARNGALITLDLGDSPLLTDQGIQAAAALCPHLEVVSIAYCEQLTDTTLIAFGQHCHNLRELNIRETDMTDTGLKAIAFGCPHLEIVDLDSCTQLTDAALIALGQHCHHLRDLDIRHTHMTDAGLRAIAAGCPLLEKLSAKVCNVGPAIEAIARGCPRLRVLISPEANVAAKARQALAECCPLLEKLDL